MKLAMEAWAGCEPAFPFPCEIQSRVRRVHVRASRKARLAAVICVLAAALGGCATHDMNTDASETARSMRVGPVSAPDRNITNFSDALRCMDGLFITYGIRDVPVMIEDLDDKTKKVTAGTKDMLISATSSMTRRSSAIRLNTFGKDSVGLLEWVLRGEQAAIFKDQPQFVIRGSVSQFDPNVISRERSGGIAIGSVVSGGVADRSAVSRMAIDLNMIHGSNFSIVPGVTSQNSIEIRTEGQGVDADATIRKLGINFNMTIAKSEGQAQGLRNLIDLAAIELFGRLSRTPYWTCLGSNAESPEVAREIEDWHFAMERNGNLVPYIQYQMRIRGYYAGPIDGQTTPSLGESVALYRAAMGGERGRTALDTDFFKRYLTVDHAKVLATNPPPALASTANGDRRFSSPNSAPNPGASAGPVAGQVAAPSSAAAPAAGRLQVTVQSATGEQIFERGQPIQLAVAANRASHVHCFMRDERQQFQRIFPNRFKRETLMRPGEALQLPGQMRFQIVASPGGYTDAVICYATERDVLAQLPRHISGADFEPLSVRSFDEIKAAFRNLTNDQYAEGVLYVRTR